MFDNNKTLTQLRNCVKNNHYIVSLHAEEEMDEDDLSIFDVEQAILTGEIIEQQKDKVFQGWKYLIHGKTIQDEYITVVVKISPTRKMVIITVFRDE